MTASQPETTPVAGAKKPLPSIVEIAPGALRGLLDAGGALTLLDVRERGERAFCAIRVAQNITDMHIPMREIPARLEEIRAALARGALVVYCHHGVRSRAAAEWLAERGVAGIMSLEGGIDAWSRETDPSVPRYA
jgi:rhodanese-related sulfurtransferase